MEIFSGTISQKSFKVVTVRLLNYKNEKKIYLGLQNTRADAKQALLLPLSMTAGHTSDWSIRIITLIKLLDETISSEKNLKTY